MIVAGKKARNFRWKVSDRSLKPAWFPEVDHLGANRPQRRESAGAKGEGRGELLAEWISSLRTLCSQLLQIVLLYIATVLQKGQAASFLCGRLN